MKMRILLPFLIFTGGLYAQDAPGKAVEKLAQSKSVPPKAQVIEEEVDISADDAKVEPAVKKEGKAEEQKSDAEVRSKVGGKAEGAKDIEKSKPQLVKPAVEMPPLSELRPLIPEPKKTVNEGIQIQVEKVREASGLGESTAKVKVTSPWPAKPLDSPPLGWKFVPAPKGIDPYRTTVKLSDKKSVNLSITPYVLVPASDGRNVIRIAEPGYQPEQGYLQEDTIGSLLKESTQDIERHEKRAAAAIQRLQQLLSSLPQS